MENATLDWRIVEEDRSIIQLFVRRAGIHPARPLIADSTVRFTWGDALIAVRGFANQYGDKLHDRDAAIFMSNGTGLLITYLSVLYCGGRPALLNAAMPRKSGQNLMASLAPSLILADHALEFEPDAVIVDAERLRGWVAQDGGTPSRAGSGADPASYFYTGGTTGVPKRILYTHERLMAAGARMQWGWPLREGDVFLPIAPYSHIYGFLAGICLPLQCGGSSVVPSRFHPAEVLDLIERERVTVLGGGPPAIYQAMMAASDIAVRDLSSLRICPGGGAAYPLEVHRRWKQMTGLAIHEGYGMTEVAPIAVNNDEVGQKAGSVGKAVPDTEIDIVDLETGSRSLPRGQVGEIRVRGPHIMPAYCGDLEETALVLRDGWVHTGDIGVIDSEGYLTITDRKKEMILHKGFNVFPREVEEAIISHPAVASVCVCGAPDERSGEIVVAYVTSRPGKSVTVEDLLQSCAAYLVSYKMPGRIEFLDALPLTPAGKVDRLALKARACGASVEAA